MSTKSRCRVYSVSGILTYRRPRKLRRNCKYVMFHFQDESTGISSSSSSSFSSSSSSSSFVFFSSSTTPDYVQAAAEVVPAATSCSLPEAQDSQATPGTIHEGGVSTLWALSPLLQSFSSSCHHHPPPHPLCPSLPFLVLLFC